mgnify:CR=1 FL=1
MEKFDESKLVRMKKHLSVIRRVAGWTAEEMGEHIGVKRQTISSLEKNPNYPMTKTQYIAIRAVLYYKMEKEQNQTLRDLVDILIVKDDLSEEELKEVDKAVEKVSQKNGRAVNSAAIAMGLSAALGAIGFAIGGVPTATMMAFQASRLVSNQTPKLKK